MAERLVKVVLDTSVYIPFVNEGIAHPILDLGFGKPLFYMSSVVMEELYAGASDRADIKLLDRLYQTFDDLNRLIVPDSGDWRTAGMTINKLGSKYGFENLFLSKLTNDVLIALSARKIGAMVITENTKDFMRIKEFVDFGLY